MAGRQAMRPSRTWGSQSWHSDRPATSRSSLGSGAPNAAGLPATRRIRSRCRRAHSGGGSMRRSSAPNSVYHCQSEETPPTTFWIT